MKTLPELRIHAIGKYLFVLVVLFIVLSFSFWAVGQAPKAPQIGQIPKEYQDKKMPSGWWTDPKVIEEGKEIFEGRENAMATCFACHGMDGKPMLLGARDMRDASYTDKMMDSYWYWRIAEGVPDTQMQPFKKILKEKQIWAVIAYEHTLSHGGKPTEHKH
jgi:mono/diheme cytochrome c family protein